jgi:tripartite-type tricarboxylate transporter receptor subunit TctC
MKTALLATIAAVAFAMIIPAQAASTVTLKVGYGAGGTYDMSSRIVARHLGKFLPGNPDIVVQNVPGAGSMKLTRLMLESEPTDGSVLGSIGPGMAYAPVLDPDNADFDSKSIIWLGSLSNEPSFCVTTKASGVDTMEKFLTGDFQLGASGKASQTYQFAALVLHGLDAKFGIVTGFEGAAEIELAMERGEIAGHCTATASDLVYKGLAERVNIIGKIGSGRVEELGDVPRFSDAISDPVKKAAAQLIESSRDVNYPLMVPPGTPTETVDVLRKAYADMTADPAFAADVEATHEFQFAPTDGAKMSETIAGHLNADANVIAAARELVK